MRRGWLALAVLVAVAFTSAGGYLAYLNTLPTAVTLSIASGQKEVPTDARLVFSFNRPVALDAVEKSFSIEPATDGAFISVSGQDKYQFVPAQQLLDLTTYTLTLRSFIDTTKHSVKARHWTFTTTIVPRITSVTGAGGAAITDGSEVQPGTTITFSFNDVMVPSTVKIILGTQPLTLAWAADSRSASTSTQGIPSGPFVVKLASGATDSTGHAIKASWTLVTGLYYSDQEHTTPLKYPALIQIPNDANAVDQNGLQAAEMVYEYVAEGGITRLTAIFGSAPDLIGPMRSSRLVSLKLGRHYKGLLFQSGESPVTRAAAGSDPVPQFFDTIGYTFRTNSRYAPDNLMITGDGVNRAETNFFPNLPAFSIAKARPSLTGGTPAPSVTVNEHSSVYTFDPIMGTYQKTEDGHAYRDAKSRQPVRIEMLIVMHTQVTQLNISDGHGSYIHDFNLETTGAADVYYKGQRYAAVWNGTDVHSPITFQTADGQPLSLPPGLVWVDVTT
ncbi:MAG TPA: DUF3048 domain-containing protein [Candidatus Dormibacteraeota bacterium]|nr:DUF3048 domain-containing protein [Candidatus Dormibacteraeota bacterium]